MIRMRGRSASGSTFIYWWLGPRIALSAAFVHQAMAYKLTGMGGRSDHRSSGDAPLECSKQSERPTRDAWHCADSPSAILGIGDFEQAVYGHGPRGRCSITR